jgi:TPR repeat protein
MLDTKWAPPSWTYLLLGRPLIRLISFLPAIAALLILSPHVMAASRGLSVEIRASEALDAPVSESLELYANSYALIIGNDDYNNGWPKLSNAVKDAELVADVLEEKGFEVELYRNLDSDGLSSAFKKFFILKGDDPTARLFVWFAGHGATIDGEGFLIPIDAPVPNDGPQFKFLSVALRDFGTYMRLSVSKHVYAVFDSCFAGTVFSSQRALPPAAITRATTLPVRQFLTSGDADQAVSDDGAFRELFIRAISGEERSDANGDGYVTASELGIFLGDRVTNLTQSQQTPRYGKLRDKNFDRGDFVFRLPSGPSVELALNSSASNNGNNAEVSFWDSIKDSDNAREFDAYLKQYPRGSFAGLAKVKKSLLQQKLSAAKQRTRPREAFKVSFLDKDLQATKTANIRQVPFPTAKRVGRLSAGDRVWGVGETVTKGGTWYKVSRDGTDMGFVYAPLLASVGNIDEIVGISPFGTPLPTGAEGISAGAINSARAGKSNESINSKEAGNSAELEVPLETQESAQELSKPDISGIEVTSDARLSSLVHGLIEEAKNSTTPNLTPNPAPTLITAAPLTSSKSSGMAPFIAKSLTVKPLANVEANTEYTAPDQVETTPAATVTADVELAQSLEQSNVSSIVQTEARGNEVVENLTAAPLVSSATSSAFISAIQDSNAAVLVAEAENNLVRQKPPQPSLIAERLVEVPSQETKEVSVYLQRYVDAAEAGNSKAQFSLGYIYETGQEAEKDIQEAVRWYREAAEANELQAMIRLGLIYENGKDLQKDLPEAAFWYRKAATGGHADAQQTIGYMYENGSGVIKDPVEAVRWYERAAAQGRVAAQNNLGRLYQLGIGVDKNLDRAIFWYEKAASQGSQAARNNLADLIPGR